MPTKDEIRRQIANIEGINQLMSGRSIDMLPDILWEDEEVADAISGTLDGKNGLLVATNKRIIFIKKGLVRASVEDIPYDKMSSLEYDQGVLFGSIKFYASGNRVHIDKIQKARVRPFAEGLRARITGAQTHASAQAPMTAIDQVKQLAELRDQGIITAEEFDAKKKQLLGL